MMWELSSASLQKPGRFGNNSLREIFKSSAVATRMPVVRKAKTPRRRMSARMLRLVCAHDHVRTRHHQQRLDPPQRNRRAVAHRICPNDQASFSTLRAQTLLFRVALTRGSMSLPLFEFLFPRADMLSSLDHLVFRFFCWD